METTVFYIIVTLLLLEIFEASWQKGKDLHELILNFLTIYKKSLFFFIALHPTLYYVIFTAITFNNFSLFMSVILIVKFLDIALKITLLDRLANKKELGFFEIMLKENIPIPAYFKYFGTLVYPALLFFALS